MNNSKNKGYAICWYIKKLITLLLAVFLFNSVYANERMSKDDLLKQWEGRVISMTGLYDKPISFKVSNGELTYINNSDSSATDAWIRDNGKLCIEYRHQDDCHRVIKTSKGVFTVKGLTSTQSFREGTSATYKQRILRLSSEEKVNGVITVAKNIKDIYETQIVNSLELRKGVPYAPGESTPFTGQLIQYHKNGNKERIVNYKKGWIDGTKTFFDFAGNKKIEENWAQDKKNGIETPWWHGGGHKKSETTYVNGHQQGRETNWHQNGKKKSEGLNGLWITWYDNGQIKSKGRWAESSYRNVKDGKWETWYQNGNKKSQVEYQDGIKINVETIWYENGNKKEETNWHSTSGMRDKVTYYSVDGKIHHDIDNRFENKERAFLNESAHLLIFIGLFLMLAKGTSSLKTIDIGYLTQWSGSLILFSFLIYWNYLWAIGGLLLGDPESYTYYYFIAIYIGLFANHLISLKSYNNKKSKANLFIAPLIIFFLSFIGCVIR